MGEEAPLPIRSIDASAWLTGTVPDVDPVVDGPVDVVPVVVPLDEVPPNPTTRVNSSGVSVSPGSAAPIWASAVASPSSARCARSESVPRRASTAAIVSVRSSVLPSTWY